jgi:hypothetical protein
MKKLDRITSGIAGGFRNLAGKQVSRSLSGATANQIEMAGTVPLVALVHKGELIIPASKVKAVKKLMKKK